VNKVRSVLSRAAFKSGIHRETALEEVPLIYAASGGHGSIFLVNALRETGRRIHIRPDVAFDLNQSLDDCPSQAGVKVFYQRTGYKLDVSKSINDNMVSYLNCICKAGEIVLITRLSRHGPFFCRNKISGVVCLVRHPLHAYVSFVGHQHPEAAQEFGELDSNRRIEWYAKQWNLLVSDYINSRNKIIRFESMHNDLAGLSDTSLPKLLKNWRPEIRNNGVLTKAKENFLKDLVAETFYKVYQDWDI
jgi:hypothetical protein